VGRIGGAPLAARELPALFHRVHGALAARRDAIDELNVFPVPDGDTGTNMTLTVRAGLEALDATQPASGAELSRAVTRGALRGARGNSGVILSQVLRAVVEVITGHRQVDARLYAQALERARDLAYEAVAQPVEGTILTVIAAAAAAAREAVERGEDLAEVSGAVCAATAEAVERTREQLQVLSDAGVVDAGARGFEILIAAVHGHLTGQDPDVRIDERPIPFATEPGGCRGSLGQPFEVQYLLDADDAAAAPLRRRLEELGDSVVVVAAGGLLNVHVHTGTVGPAIEVGLEFGRPSDIEVVHFGDQIAARAGHRTTTIAAAGHTVPSAGRETVTVGAVAVLSGSGAKDLATSLGAVVVDGQAGSLPSVEHLLEAIQAAAGAHVLVLPGHRNVVPAAHSAARLAAVESDRRVEVIVSAATPPSVLAALAVLDPAGEIEAVIADVRGAAEAVRCGEVVTAVRDAETPMGPVRRGQPLGLVGGRVVTISDDPVAALAEVCSSLSARDAEVVTLMLGADVTSAQRTDAIAVLEGTTEAELDVIEAGQRPSVFWIGVE
jgi:uncharacterized protein